MVELARPLVILAVSCALGCVPTRGDGATFTDVRDDRVYAVGFGEDFPLDEADTPQAREKNRRVDFFIEETR